MYCDQYATPSGPFILAVYEVELEGHCIVIPPFAVIGTLFVFAGILYVGWLATVGESQTYIVESKSLYRLSVYVCTFGGKVIVLYVLSVNEIVLFQ